MRKLLLFVWVCVGLVSFGQPAGAQEATIRKTATPNATSSDREQDGLNGPVRRVRIETAKIVVKDEKPIEGSRVVRGTTTYDINGRKIDTVARPVEGSAPSGKEQYHYDDKGNITEMVVRGNDGSILSKEIYQYESDELGNWKKMTTSVAVYEDGKLSFEPVEVTYRIITYYYGQGIGKMAAASAAKPPPVSAPSVSPVLPKSVSGSQTAEGAIARERKPVSNEHATVAVIGGEGNRSENKNPATPVVSPSPEDGTSAKNGSSKTTETTSAPAAASEIPPVSPDKTPVAHVSEETLRSAAINLPQPELPLAAELTGQQGRVEVQVIIDEKGEVTSARGVSGNSLLNEAAEAAALKARFSPAKFSPDPARVFGVITYDFPRPSKGIPAVVPPTVRPDENGMATAPNAGASHPNSDTPVSSGTNSAALSVAPSLASSEDAGHFYTQGLSRLMAGRYTEAVAALRQAVDRNPEDALAYTKLGLAYSGLHQNKETIAVLKLAIRLKAQVVDAEAYYRLGEAYAALTKHSEAVGAFKQVMSIIRAQALEPDESKYSGFPTFPDLHYDLALAYHNLGRYGDAIKELKQATTLKPEFAEAYYGLALAYIGIGDRRSAARQEQIVRPLNSALADKIAVALSNVNSVTVLCRGLGCPR
jgi:TonB family protein